MEWILLEILVALGLAGFIVWYTTGSSAKQRRHRPDDARKNQPSEPLSPPGPRER